MKVCGIFDGWSLKGRKKSFLFSSAQIDTSGTSLAWLVNWLIYVMMYISITGKEGEGCFNEYAITITIKHIYYLITTIYRQKQIQYIILKIIYIFFLFFEVSVDVEFRLMVIWFSKCVDADADCLVIYFPLALAFMIRSIIMCAFFFFLLGRQTYISKTYAA